MNLKSYLLKTFILGAFIALGATQSGSRPVGEGFFPNLAYYLGFFAISAVIFGVVELFKMRKNKKQSKQSNQTTKS